LRSSFLYGDTNDKTGFSENVYVRTTTISCLLIESYGVLPDYGLLELHFLAGDSRYGQCLVGKVGSPIVNLDVRKKEETLGFAVIDSMFIT
jgi:hypothetical protein